MKPKTIISAIGILFIASCTKPLEESSFIEFTIDGLDGTERNAAVYLPKGWTSKKQWPAVFMEDGLVFKDCNYKNAIDSLVELGEICPVVVACSYENKKKVPGYSISYRNAEFVENISKTDATLTGLFEQHLSYFTNEFMPYIQEKYSAGLAKDERVYYGTSNSADFGLTLSFRNSSLFEEYWCFSPVNSDITGYGMLQDKVSYRICWGIHEELEIPEYFPPLMNSIRKRGGTVKSQPFNGGHDRGCWRELFIEELKMRFPAQ